MDSWNSPVIDWAEVIGKMEVELVLIEFIIGMLFPIKKELALKLFQIIRRVVSQRLVL